MVIVPRLAAYLGHKSYRETCWYIHLTVASFPELSQKLDRAFVGIIPVGGETDEENWLYQNCLDKAVIENFFGLLKSELLYLQEFRSMEHFKLELVAYLDYYNNRRIKAKLKGLPPAIHRQQALSAAWTIFTSEYCLTFWGHFKEIGCREIENILKTAEKSWNFRWKTAKQDGRGEQTLPKSPNKKVQPP